MDRLNIFHNIPYANRAMGFIDPVCRIDTGGHVSNRVRERDTFSSFQDLTRTVTAPVDRRRRSAREDIRGVARPSL
jgi:hypothetical protein